MNDAKDKEAQRRQLLKWFSASPLLSGLPIHESLAQERGRRPDPMVWTSNTNIDDLIKNPSEAINVFDFEPVAFKKVPPAHFGYMASGIDDEVTLRANRQSFLKYQLRPRRMRDVSSIDMSVNLFGTRWKTPIIIAPTGGNKAYDPEGEIAVARAARAGGYLNILSSAASSTIEDVIAARPGEVWYQLYATSSVDVSKQIVRRMEKAGVPVLEITVDRNGGRNQETFFKLRKQDPRACVSCHTHGFGTAQARPNYSGIDMTGVDGSHVSNHGGRSADTGRGAIDCLPEIATVVKGRVPIVFDSGVRRGSDIFKALSMGATAVCVGRPYLWGLGAFGQAGVERVMDILKTELYGVMQQMGTPNTAAIQKEMVIQA